MQLAIASYSYAQLKFEITGSGKHRHILHRTIRKGGYALAAAAGLWISSPSLPLVLDYKLLMLPILLFSNVLLLLITPLLLQYYSSPVDRYLSLIHI